MTTDSWIFCHRWARKIWMSEILSVGICVRRRVRVSFFSFLTDDDDDDELERDAPCRA